MVEVSKAGHGARIPRVLSCRDRVFIVGKGHDICQAKAMTAGLFSRKVRIPEHSQSAARLGCQIRGDEAIVVGTYMIRGLES